MERKKKTPSKPRAANHALGSSERSVPIICLLYQRSHIGSLTHEYDHTPKGRVEQIYLISSWD